MNTRTHTHGPPARWRERRDKPHPRCSVCGLVLDDVLANTIRATTHPGCSDQPGPAERTRMEGGTR